MTQRKYGGPKFPSKNTYQRRDSETRVDWSVPMAGRSSKGIRPDTPPDYVLETGQFSSSKAYHGSSSVN